jgi:putative membrane protein insertion efficiency factor
MAARNASHPPELIIVVRAVRESVASVVAAVLVLLVRLYRLTLSPLLGPSCKFNPSCSSYAIEAIRLDGPLRGTRRAIGRLGRCHPWSEGGFDPVR